MSPDWWKITSAETRAACKATARELPDTMTWNDRFLTLFDRSVAAYRAENKDFETYYDDEDRAMLAEIGCKSREFFDFVEDFCDEGAPSASTALLIAAVRRDYFLVVQEGSPSGKVFTRDDIPGFGEEIAGLPYFPRILAKARAKLRGELDPDLMFGCGGDRNFLSKHGHIHPADFLRHVWATGENTEKLASWIAKSTP